DVDKAVVLIVLADLVQVLFQLGLVQPTGFIDEINERFATGFHLLSQHRLASMRVTLETDLAHCASDTFGDSENNPGRAAFLVDGIDTKLDAYVGESPRLINVDDFLTRLFQMLFVNRLIQSYFDFLAQSLRLDPFGAGDFDLAYNRPRLNGNDHLHA